MTAPPRLSVGSAIGSYRVQELLGVGATAEVWRAVHESGAPTCALKVLHGARPEVERRLLREARLLALVRHPNVVTLIEVLSWDAVPVLALELVDGPTLVEWLALRRASVEVARALGAALALGVREVHRTGLVHRDLKPQNVLVAQPAEGLLPKVADFGIARMDHALDGSLPSQTATAFGTPGYMAPEQFQEPGRVDRRSDLFALGCVLYELLAGRPPFCGRTVFDLYSRIIASDYPPLSELRPDAPAALVAAIRRCLVPDLERRVADCDELLAAWAADPLPATGIISGPAALRVAPEELAAHRAAAAQLRLRQAHIAPERLASRQPTADEELHLSTCARCRVERRDLLDVVDDR